MTACRNIPREELVLSTKRLVLKPLEPEDTGIVTEIWTDPEVTRYVGGPVKKSKLIADFHKYLRRCAGGAVGVWTLTTTEDNKQIGTAILLPMPIEVDDTDWDLIVGDQFPDAEIEVGYVLKKSAWGKGYATEACRRLVQFAFEKTSLDEVVATIDYGNEASGKVLTKSGLVHEGPRRAYATECPGFRITRAQWEQSGEN